jgi:hypothetical protein
VIQPPGTPLVLMPFGSHLYGTDTPKSDHDFKGVFLPLEEDLLLGRAPRSVSTSTGPRDAKNRPEDVDTEWYSLHYFLELACQGQTVAIDMLHASPEHWLVHSQAWYELRERRREFYTSNLQAFVGYCRKQAAKYGVKGSRLDAVRNVIRVLELTLLSTPPLRLGHLLDQNLIQLGEHIEIEVLIDPHDPQPDRTKRRFLIVCGKRLQDTMTTAAALEPLRHFERQYGFRAQEAAENRGIDWKAVSHALRAAFELQEIYTTGDLRFPLAERAYLRQIKSGALDYTTVVAPALENLISHVEGLAARCGLPEKVNRGKWDRWLLDAVRRSYRDELRAAGKVLADLVEHSGACASNVGEAFAPMPPCNCGVPDAKARIERLT